MGYHWGQMTSLRQKQSEQMEMEDVAMLRLDEMSLKQAERGQALTQIREGLAKGQNSS